MYVRKWFFKEGDDALKIIMIKLVNSQADTYVAREATEPNKETSNNEQRK